jgi:predicted DNA binding CopG/RHH family protein
VTSPTVIELMTAFSQPFTGPAAAVPASELLRRKPQRVTATLPWHLVHRLEERASYEGRSLSNLIAHLLEVAG